MQNPVQGRKDARLFWVTLVQAQVCSLPPLPPLIFRDVAKAEEEGSPFGGGGVLFLVKAPSSVCNEF